MKDPIIFILYSRSLTARPSIVIGPQNHRLGSLFHHVAGVELLVSGSVCHNMTNMSNVFSTYPLVGASVILDK